MSYLIAAPEIMATATAQLANINSTLEEAHRFAVSSILAMAPSAADEVSVGIAQLFAGQARDYQAAAVRAAAFHEQFLRTLAAGANAYASAEASGVEQLVQGLINAPTRFLLGRPLIGDGVSGAPGTGQAGEAGGILWGNGGNGGSGGPGQAGGRGGDAG
ncbi:PE family protein, partial [Mycobacterium intermedium]